MFRYEDIRHLNPKVVNTTTKTIQLSWAHNSFRERTETLTAVCNLDLSRKSGKVWLLAFGDLRVQRREKKQNATFTEDV